MNQAGIDVLIQAGLSGHRQAYDQFHGDNKDDCAFGVLHLTMHTTQEEARKCLDGYFSKVLCLTHIMTRYDMTAEEYEKIIALNDLDHLDFIGIARKLEGHTER